MSEDTSYYPLFLSLRDKKCIVLGGGQVALRKVTALLKCTQDITVISPRLCAGLQKLSANGKIQTVRRNYQAGDMEGIHLAIIATSSSKVNLEAAAEARGNKVLVNVVDNPQISDFIVPSIVRRGNLALAISTGGYSPSLARKIRKKLELEFGSNYASLTSIVAGVRETIRKRRIKVSSRDWQEAIDLDAMIGLIAEGQARKARALLLRRLIESKRK